MEQQGSIQSARLIRFTDVNRIRELSDVLKSYVMEAIAVEESGQKVETVRNPESVPEELEGAFKEDAAFKKAFYALTPGRQRGYLIHFSQPKQTATRFGRIEKYRQRILDGLGLHDR